MTPAFRLAGLQKSFSKFELGPLDFELEPGTVLGYVGPNGSGKSTTMHCMVGLLRPDAGEITIFGKVNDLNAPDWKLDVGYVGDEHVFYENWSGEKNLKFLAQFFPSWSDDIVLKLTERFDLDLKIKVNQLSKGNRVKLALISALAYSPRLLLLDEPTSGLDPVVRSEVLEVLFEILEDGERAIFYSTHILSDISRLADELAFLDNGQVKLREAKEDLMDKWRVISYKLEQNEHEIAGCVSHKSEGKYHQVISSDFVTSLDQIRQLGGEDIQESRMTIDEIAVQILRKRPR